MIEYEAVRLSPSYRYGNCMHTHTHALSLCLSSSLCLFLSFFDDQFLSGMNETKKLMNYSTFSTTKCVTRIYSTSHGKSAKKSDTRCVYRVPVAFVLSNKK